MALLGPKQTLSQKLQQKLSPQQIQLMKLLQIPTASLDQRIQEELEVNPALESGEDGDELFETDQEAEYYSRDASENNSESHKTSKQPIQRSFPKTP